VSVFYCTNNYFVLSAHGRLFPFQYSASSLAFQIIFPIIFRMSFTILFSIQQLSSCRLLFDMIAIESRKNEELDLRGRCKRQICRISQRFFASRCRCVLSKLIQLRKRLLNVQCESDPSFRLRRKNSPRLQQLFRTKKIVEDRFCQATCPHKTSPPNLQVQRQA
jgi:hypothetical protein